MFAKYHVRGHVVRQSLHEFDELAAVVARAIGHQGSVLQWLNGAHQVPQATLTTVGSPASNRAGPLSVPCPSNRRAGSVGRSLRKSAGVSAAACLSD
uniref:Uncharacterized protein n=1 Tax=Plectus sambesii TaxID=2011161 RepID=A0A914X0R1_9BILA